MKYCTFIVESSYVIFMAAYAIICRFTQSCTRTHMCVRVLVTFPTAFLQPKSCSMSLSVHSCSSEPKGSSLSSETVTQLRQHPLHPPSAGLCNEMVLRQAVLQVAFGQRKHVNHLGIAIDIYGLYTPLTLRCPCEIHCEIHNRTTTHATPRAGPSGSVDVVGARFPQAGRKRRHPIKSNHVIRT